MVSLLVFLFRQQDSADAGPVRTGDADGRGDLVAGGRDVAGQPGAVAADAVHAQRALRPRTGLGHRLGQADPRLPGTAAQRPDAAAADQLARGVDAVAGLPLDPSELGRPQTPVVGRLLHERQGGPRLRHGRTLFPGKEPSLALASLPGSAFQALVVLVVRPK